MQDKSDKSPTGSIAVRAYAKINLGLRILRKRSDGFHDIETVFHRIDLYDTVTVEPAEAIGFHTDDPALAAGDLNLCVKAAKLLLQQTHMQKGASIHLKKCIPVGAGLGGGSADAAATLHALTKLWNISPADAELRRIALELGSDVPYFLFGGSAYATGRGEQLEYFRLDLPYWILVVYPDIQISSAWAYRQVAPVDNAGEQSLRETILKLYNRPKMLRPALRNDFELIALRTYPELLAIKRTMEQSGAFLVQLSGSGSALYGLFTGQSDAESAQKKLHALCRVFLTPPGFQPE